MKNEKNCQAGTDIMCHGDGTIQDRQRPRGINHSLSPGVPCPETVLVVVMSDGSYLLVGYPQHGPTAFVMGEDADLLRRRLEGAFGSPTAETVRGNGNSSSNEAVLPDNKAPSTKQIQL